MKYFCVMIVLRCALHELEFEELTHVLHLHPAEQLLEALAHDIILTAGLPAIRAAFNENLQKIFLIGIKDEQLLNLKQINLLTLLIYGTMHNLWVDEIHEENFQLLKECQVGLDNLKDNAQEFISVYLKGKKITLNAIRKHIVDDSAVLYKFLMIFAEFEFRRYKQDRIDQLINYYTVRRCNSFQDDFGEDHWSILRRLKTFFSEQAMILKKDELQILVDRLLPLGYEKRALMIFFDINLITFNTGCNFSMLRTFDRYINDFASKAYKKFIQEVKKAIRNIQFEDHRNFDLKIGEKRFWGHKIELKLVAALILGTPQEFSRVMETGFVSKKNIPGRIALTSDIIKALDDFLEYSYSVKENNEGKLRPLQFQNSNVCGLKLIDIDYFLAIRSLLQTKGNFPSIFDILTGICSLTTSLALTNVDTLQIDFSWLNAQNCDRSLIKKLYDYEYTSRVIKTILDNESHVLEFAKGFLIKSYGRGVRFSDMIDAIVNFMQGNCHSDENALQLLKEVAQVKDSTELDVDSIFVRNQTIHNVLCDIGFDFSKSKNDIPDFIDSRMTTNKVSMGSLFDFCEIDNTTNWGKDRRFAKIKLPSTPMKFQIVFDDDLDDLFCESSRQDKKNELFSKKSSVSTSKGIKNANNKKRRKKRCCESNKFLVDPVLISKPVETAAEMINSDFISVRDPEMDPICQDAEFSINNLEDWSKEKSNITSYNQEGLPRCSEDIELEKPFFSVDRTKTIEKGLPILNSQIKNEETILEDVFLDDKEQKNISVELRNIDQDIIDDKASNTKNNHTLSSSSKIKLNMQKLHEDTNSSEFHTHHKTDKERNDEIDTEITSTNDGKVNKHSIIQATHTLIGKKYSGSNSWYEEEIDEDFDLKNSEKSHQKLLKDDADMPFASNSTVKRAKNKEKADDHAFELHLDHFVTHEILDKAAKHQCSGVSDKLHDDCGAADSLITRNHSSDYSYNQKRTLSDRPIKDKLEIIDSTKVPITKNGLFDNSGKTGIKNKNDLILVYDANSDSCDFMISQEEISDVTQKKLTQNDPSTSSCDTRKDHTLTLDDDNDRDCVNESFKSDIFVKGSSNTAENWNVYDAKSKVELSCDEKLSSLPIRDEKQQNSTEDASHNISEPNNSLNDPSRNEIGNKNPIREIPDPRNHEKELTDSFTRNSTKTRSYNPTLSPFEVQHPRFFFYFTGANLQIFYFRDISDMYRFDNILTLHISSERMSVSSNYSPPLTVQVVYYNQEKNKKGYITTKITLKGFHHKLLIPNTNSHNSQNHEFIEINSLVVRNILTGGDHHVQPNQFLIQTSPNETSFYNCKRCSSCNEDDCFEIIEYGIFNRLMKTCDGKSTDTYHSLYIPMYEDDPRGNPNIFKRCSTIPSESTT